MSEPQEPPRRIWDSRWIRRLPLLLVAAVGLVFLLPRVPKDVEVDYDLGRAQRGLAQVDVEVLDAAGRPMHRTVFNQPEKHVVQHLKLPKGEYRAELELKYPDHNEQRARRFTVGEVDAIDLDVERP